MNRPGRRGKKSGRKGRKYTKPGPPPAFHGNWLGPGWSNGERQDSVDYRYVRDFQSPVDAADKAAMYHDAAYARAKEHRGRGARRRLDFDDPYLIQADEEFARAAKRSKTWIGKAAGIAVGAQGAARKLVARLRHKPTSVREGQHLISNEMTKISSKFVKNRRADKQTLRAESAQVFTINAKHCTAFGISSTTRRLPWVGAPYLGSYVSNPDPSTTTNDINMDSPYFMAGATLLRYILKKTYGTNVESGYQAMHTLVPMHTNTVLGVNQAQPIRITLANIRLFVQIDSPHANQIQRGVTPVTGMTGINLQESDVTVYPTNSFYQQAAVLGNALMNSTAEHQDIAAGQIETGNQGIRLVRNNWNLLYGYSLCEVEGVSANGAFTETNYRYSPIQKIKDLQIDYRIVTKVNMQNQTSSATSTDKTIDSVENNPLTGKILHFNTALPVLNTSVFTHGVLSTTADMGKGVPMPNDTHMAQVWTSLGVYDKNNDGIMFNTKSPSDDIPSLRQLPATDYYANCSGYQPTKISPGEITSFSLVTEFKGSLSQFLRKVRICIAKTGVAEGSSTGEYQYLRLNGYDSGLGVSRVVCLKKMLDEDNDEKLTVAVGLRRYSTMKFLYNKNTSMDPMINVVRNADVAAADFVVA